MSKLKKTENGYEYTPNALDPNLQKSLKIRIMYGTYEETILCLERITEMVKFGLLHGKASRAKTGVDFDFSIRDIEED